MSETGQIFIRVLKTDIVRIDKEESHLSSISLRTMSVGDKVKKIGDMREAERIFIR